MVGVWKNRAHFEPIQNWQRKNGMMSNFSFLPLTLQKLIFIFKLPSKWNKAVDEVAKWWFCSIYLNFFSSFLLILASIFVFIEDV